MKKALVILIVCLIGIAGLQSSAWAAPIPDKLNIQLWPEYDDNQVLFMETSEYPSDAPLPIEVKMAIPKGATVEWAGEILGGDVSQDIKAVTQTADKGDFTEVTFTLNKARKAQLEARWNGVKSEGDKRTITLDWVQGYEAKSTQFGFKAPSYSSEFVFSPQFSPVGQSPDNLQFYISGPLALAVGQKQTVNITYKRTATGASVTQQQLQGNQQGQSSTGSGQAASSSDTVVYGLIIAAAAVLLYALYRHQQGNRAAYEEDDEPFEEPVAKPKKSPSKSASAKASGSKAKAKPKPVPADVGDDFFED